MKDFSNAVVIGAGGFIGSHLCPLLEKNGVKVFTADLDYSKGGISLDVRKTFDIAGDFGDKTVIFNLAAVHRTPGHPDQEYFETNIRGAENVCGFARRHSIQNIVFTSSISPYGASENYKTEDSLPTPNTPYGISKLLAEHIHKEWAAESPENYLSVVRPGIVFGKGENGNMTRLYKGLKSRTFVYAGRKDTIKAAIYVKDLVRILFEMATSPKAKVQTYNCTIFPAPTIQTIVETMNKVSGLNRFVPYIPKKPVMMAASVAGLLGGLGLGICPERVRKLMISTNISGEKLNRDYPLQWTLESAFEDWLGGGGSI